MRLVSCHIDNFGTLRNFDMIFDDGINVIMRENGWGKSTLAAFLKAMLYGYDNKRSDVARSERLRYLPWQGGKYGGTLIFEKAGKQYKVERSFGETPRGDTVSFCELESGDPVPGVRNVGEWLFRLDSDAFRRCAYIDQDPFAPGGSGLSFHARLNAVLGEASGVGDYDSALAHLTQRMNDYEKTDGRGYLTEIQKRIDELLAKQKTAEEKIRSVEVWRRELEKLDERLEQGNEAIARLKRKIDQQNAGKKERDTVMKLYSQLKDGQNELTERINELLREAHGEIPKPAEIQEIKQSCGEISRISETLKKLREQSEKKSAEIRAQYNALLDEKSGLEKELALITADGAVPEEDEIQAVRQGRAELVRVSEALETITAQEEKKKAEFMEKHGELIRRKNDLEQKLGSVLSAGDIPEEEELRTVRQNTAEIARVSQALDAVTRQAEEEAEKLRGRYNELVGQRNALADEYAAASEGLGSDPPPLPEIREAKRRADHISALRDDAEKIKEKRAKLESRANSVKSRYRSGLPGTAEVSDILQTCNSLNELRNDINENENDPAYLEAKQRRGELLNYFGEELPDAEALRRTEDDISQARALESEIAELEAQIASERAKRSGVEKEISGLEAADKALVFTASMPRLTGGVLCMVASVIAAIVGLVFAPLAFAVSGGLLLIGIILLVVASKRKNNYRAKRHEFEEQKRAAGEKIDMMRVECGDIGKNIRRTQSELQTRQDEADRLYSEALSYISAWIDTVTKETLAQGCSELLTDLRELKAAQDTVNAHEEKLIKQKSRFKAMNDGLQAKLAVLPADTEKLSVRERVSSALADIETMGQLRAELKSCDEQLSDRNSRLRQLSDSIGGVLKRCSLTIENAAEMLPEYEKKVLAAGGIKQRLDEQNSRVIEFERNNGDILSGEREISPDSPEGRLRSQLSELSAGVRRVLDKYSRGEDDLEAWLDLSEKRSVFRNKALQMQRELDKQINDLEASNEQYLSERVIDPDSAEGKLRSQLDGINERIGSVLGKYGVPEGSADEWLDNSERRLSKKLSAEHKMSAVDKQITDFRNANKTELESAALPDDPAWVNLQTRLQKLTKNVAVFMKKHEITKGMKLSQRLEAIEAQAAEYAELCRRRSAHAAQIKDFELKHKAILEKQDSVQESDTGSLSLQLMEYENNRDLLMRERAAAEGNIRQADETVGSYRTIVQQLRELCEEKQEAQKSLYVLKKSKELLKKARQSLASRYLGQIEDSFNQYLSGWIMEKDLRGIVDVDFNVTMEKDGAQRTSERYSTGYTDMIDFCMRMALIDTLFEEERPFIIMDDPFVNLDEERLEHALSLLKTVSSENQVIYFVCHPIRAGEPGTASVLPERIKRAKPFPVQKTQAPAARKAAYALHPEEAILPRGTERRITAGIFSLDFVPEPALAADGDFEVFFVDENEKVICDKQQLSYSDGELFPARIRFCLNTEKASGSVYTLIIRSTSSAENEAAGRIPYNAVIAPTA